MAHPDRRVSDTALKLISIYSLYQYEIWVLTTLYLNIELIYV
jgi:hypothetical protein